MLVVANVVLFLLTRERDAGASVGEADTQMSVSTGAVTSAPPTPASAAPTSAPGVLAVYGDGYAAGNEEGGLGAAGWPVLVAARTGMTLSLHAVPQAGYVSVGSTGQDYAGLVETAPVPDAAVTLVVGSRNDRSADAAEVLAQVQQVVNDVRAAAPSTIVVVVGPVWSDGEPPADVLDDRDAVKTAATAAGVAFVDPIARNWFAQPTGLISSDGVSPTDAGHAHLADLITPWVTAALSQQQ
ncbi:Lysophospholipase L1 [Modestobacter sp. DSM 44400]|uniref:SGNH/GDSL hydrolase family protein n=1 Tax=Modestobacter sp. DSM 44400 TaxID=1550230 RepID=UPI00089AE8EC|nr:SGNH/GDSL hydrolase family protein [Modestobacter sp. DSM 44400]SDY39231.1 Lysophospholipase L1 [Modestobacter sp. DSM 44400]